jgi:hypothetical protein
VSDEPIEEAEFGLRMPFVVTSDNGGPFDASAYTAGWEMGALDARLDACVHHRLGPPTVVIRRENVPQAELVAMSYGMVLTEQHMELEDTENADEVRAEWAACAFTWGTPLP